MTAGTTAASAGSAAVAAPSALAGGLPRDRRRTANGRPRGVLKAFDTAADDALTLGIYLDELVGDMRIHTVQTAGAPSLTTGNVSLRTVNGSILDAEDQRRRRRPTSHRPGDRHRRQRRLDRHGRQRPRHRLVGRLTGAVRRYGASCADPTTDGSADPGLPPQRRRRPRGDPEHLPDRDRRVPAPRACARGQRRHPAHGPRDCTADRIDEDLYLVAERHARASPRATRARRAATTSTRRAACPRARSSPRTATSPLRVGDDVTTHQNSEILADDSIDIFGDYRRRSTPGYGHEHDPARPDHRRLRRRDGPASGDPVGTCTPATTNPVAGQAHPDLGQQRHRHVPVRRPVGHRPGERDEHARQRPGYIFLGSKTTSAARRPRRLHADACLSADVDLYAAGDRRTSTRTSSPSGTCSR